MLEMDRNLDRHIMKSQDMLAAPKYLNLVLTDLVTGAAEGLEIWRCIY